MTKYFNAVFARPADGSRPIPIKIDTESDYEAWQALDKAKDYVTEGDIPCVPILVMHYRTRLELYRRLADYSQDQLANITDIPVRTIRAYEQGTRSLYNAAGDRLARLCGALNCSFIDLLTEVNR